MSSDEDDYMSEKFLKACAKQVKDDTAPGLTWSRSVKRQHDIAKKKSAADEAKRSKTARESEEGRRREGLDRPIGSDNRGFSLMQKMGYKPGQGIGKNETGQVQPIDITVKTDRFGLGRDTVLKEIAVLRAKKLAAKLMRNAQACDVYEYRRRLAEKSQERFTRADLNKSQRMCEILDLAVGIVTPDEAWFWPSREECEDEQTEIEQNEPNEFEPAEQLEMLTNYLRSCHVYCIWCGTHYDSDVDMNSHCPGSTREDH